MIFSIKFSIRFNCVFEGKVDISAPSPPRYHLQNTNLEKLAQVCSKVTSLKLEQTESFTDDQYFSVEYGRPRYLWMPLTAVTLPV